MSEENNKPAEGVVAEEIPVASAQDREQHLANAFEDPSIVAEVEASARAEEPVSPAEPHILEETASAVQELVGEALQIGAVQENLSQEAALEAPASEVPESVSPEAFEVQALPVEAAPLETAAAAEFVGSVEPAPVQDHHEIQPDISLAEAANTAEPAGIPHHDIQPNISLAEEANQVNPVGGVELALEGSTGEALSFIAKSEMAERLFQLVLCELRFDDVVEGILSALMKSVDAQAGSILEVDHGKSEFFFRASAGGGDPEKLKAFRVPMHKGIVGHVAESRQPILLQDMEDNDMQLRAISMSVGFETKSCIAAPILIASQLYGVVELFNKSGVSYFDAKDLSIIEDGLKMAAKVLEVRFFIAELVRQKQ